MKTLTKMIGVAGLMAMSGVAGAATATVDYVTWNPDSPFDFSADTATNTVFQTDTVLSGNTRVLNGAGQILNLNSSPLNIASGFSLYFSFSGYTYDTTTDIHNGLGGPFKEIVAHNGVVDFWVVDKSLFPSLTNNLGIFNTISGVSAFHDNMVNASAGVYNFLSLTAAQSQDAYGNLGTLFVDGFLGAAPNLFPLILGNGLGLMNVVGGDAADYFDTDSISQFTNGFNTAYMAQGQYADLSFRSNIGLNNSQLVGDAHLYGDSTTIPEPETLLLLGLGLLGMVFSKRNSFVV